MAIPQARQAKQMASEGMSSGDILDLAAAQVQRLKSLLKAGTSKDSYVMILTNLHVGIELLARRVQSVEWTGGKLAVQDDDEAEAAHRRADEEQVAMALADVLADDWAADERTAELQEGVCEGCAANVAELMRERSVQRKEDFVALMEYQTRGAKTPQEVAKRVLAITRRVKPEMLVTHFGMSQSDVSRALGETRATVSAREKRVIEKPLKEAGVKGFKLAGGVRTEAHRKRCAEAQKGNRHRHEGELRKRES